jgi:CubicO group peptidase (beta-lactamase class C family)
MENYRRQRSTLVDYTFVVRPISWAIDDSEKSESLTLMRSHYHSRCNLFAVPQYSSVAASSATLMRAFNNFILGTLITLFTLSTLPCVRADSVDGYITGEMKSHRIPGLSLAVIKDGHLVKVAGYGLSDIETGTPAAPATVYKIASLSKPIIATAILLLAQEGRLSLSDTVPNHLPNAPNTWSNITIRHLLSHTSGLVRDPSDYHPYVEQQPIAVIESAYSLPLQSKPGEKWSYSNIGYFILAEVITRVSGMPWSDFVAKTILEPAGMKSTRLTSVSAIIPNRAHGYEIGEAGWINAEDWIAVRPSGAYLSTVLDLAKLDTFLETSNPLNAANRAAMITPAVLLDGKATSFGFGWNVDSFLGQARISHSGQYPGFRSDWERYPSEKLTVIIMSNLGSFPIERLVPKIAGFYCLDLITPEFSASVTSPADSFSVGKQGIITIVTRSVSRSSPDTVVELEIWNEANKSVDKQSRTGEDFSKGESKAYNFTWTPTKPGRYTVNFGVYGPKWNPSYSWSQAMAIINVR